MLISFNVQSNHKEKRKNITKKQKQKAIRGYTIVKSYVNIINITQMIVGNPLLSG